jgi:head-tail adaptor
MTAGRRDQKIVIQRGTASTDDYGGETLTWATLATEWAAVFYGKGDERRQAAVEQGNQAATFQVLANTNTRSVGVKDRISHNGSFWDIVGVAPMDRGKIEFAAVRAL